MRTIRKMQDPNMPIVEEVKRHELTHMPYKSWCAHRARGRGKRMQHRRQDVKDRAITEVHLEDCFMRSEESEGKNLTTLLARERDAGMTCSTVVPRKGALDSFASKRVLIFCPGNRVRAQLCHHQCRLRASDLFAH